MAYKHGVYVREQASSVIAAASVDAGLPVVIGVGLSGNNEPQLVNSYAEAEAAIGGVVGVGADGLFKYSLSEFVKAYFVNHGLSRAVLIDVFDPSKHLADEAGSPISATLENGIATTTAPADTYITAIKIGENAVPAADYIVDRSGSVLRIIRNGSATVLQADSTISIENKAVDLTKVTADDIKAGIAKVQDVYPRFGLVPGQIVCPKYSSYPSIAATMQSNSNNINGSYSCVALIDIPTAAGSITSGQSTEAVTGVTAYTDVYSEKQEAGISAPSQVALWPMAKLGAEIYHMSCVWASVTCLVDAQNNGVPVATPSNKIGLAKLNATVLANGTEVWLDKPKGNELNGKGICTALNLNGWRCWGSRTAAYDAVTDPKDASLPERRMFSWVGNTLVNTFFQNVDSPLNAANIQIVRDSANIWLNGLCGAGYLVGGPLENHVEFNESENPTVNLSAGTAVFHVYIAPPAPMRVIDFVLEYNTNAYASLFE